MQMLYSIHEIAVLLLQICLFLIVLIAIWLIIIAAAEICRDRLQEVQRKELIEACEKKLNKTGVKEPEPVIERNIEHEKAAAIFECALREYMYTRKHLEAQENNYRKMHGFPLIRRKGEKKHV